ncbi:peptidase S8/S53 domain-containing protein [Dipodascopsis uninucleata]
MVKINVILALIALPSVALSAVPASQADHSAKASTRVSGLNTDNIPSIVETGFIKPSMDHIPSSGIAGYANIFINKNFIRDRYIIVFKNEITQDQIMAHYRWVKKELRFTDDTEQRILDKFDKVLNMYSGRFFKSMITRIAKRSEIAFIESDTFITAYEYQHGAPYNLARISHRDRLNTTTRSVYQYDENPGLGTTIYVLDTGVRTTHEEFGGRARLVNLVPGSTDTDTMGHGTHVAATAAGSTFGVAKNASIVGIKVLNDRGRGRVTSILSGLQYVADHHEPGTLEVVNMSLGGIRSFAMNMAAANVVNRGVHVVVAAGNSGRDACTVSPASEPTVLTVGASDHSDSVAMFSNHGDCVDIFAPGVDILSAGIRNDRATSFHSGTSMASPLVAGVTAYLLAKDPSVTVTGLQDQIKGLASIGMLKFVPHDGTPNLLAYNGFGED